MSETTDVKSQSEAGDAAPWLAATMPCVYCGRPIDRDSQRCPQCKTSYSIAVRKASREIEGQWFYLESRNPSNRGIDFNTMLKLIEKGRLRADSIVRGPTTHQDWMYAAEAPMLSKHLGNCPHCFAPAQPAEEFCTTCSRNLDQIPGRLKPGLSAPTANVRFTDREQLEQTLADALKTHELARSAAMAAAAAPAAAPPRPQAAPEPAIDPIVERSSVMAAGGRQQREREERRRPKAAIVALLTVVTLIPLALGATYIPWYGLFFWSDADRSGTIANNIRSNQNSIKSSLAGLFGGGSASASSAQVPDKADPARDPHVLGIIEAADAAAADGNFQRAIMLITPLVTDYPGTPLADDVSAKRSRWQAQSDRQAGTELARRKLASARDLLDSGKPQQALATLAELQGSARETVRGEAEELEQQIRTAIRAADAEEKQKQVRAEVLALVQNATAQEQQNKLPEALATYKDIQNRFNQTLWPAGVNVTERIANLERRIARAIAPPADTPPPVDPQRTLATSLWREVQKLDTEKKYEQSLAKAEELKAMPSKYRPGELDEKIAYLKKRIELQRKYDFFNID